MNPISWWRQRDTRERQIISVAVLIMSILVMYLTFEPIWIENKRMREALPQLRTDLSWMQKHTGDMRSLLNQAGTNDTTKLKEVSLSSIQTIINNMTLQKNLGELGPDANQSIRVVFKEIAFPDLMNFTYHLNNNLDVKVINASITHIGNQDGMVQALLILGM